MAIFCQYACKVGGFSLYSALLGGELPLRYCSGRFACRVPTWSVPARGHVQGLVPEFASVGEVLRDVHVVRAQLLQGPAVASG